MYIICCHIRNVGRAPQNAGTQHIFNFFVRCHIDQAIRNKKEKCVFGTLYIDQLYGFYSISMSDVK